VKAVRFVIEIRSPSFYDILPLEKAPSV